MLFNSISFLIFLTLFFTLFWSTHKFSLKFQNSLILFASYIFYGWWDWRFLILIFISSCADFVLAKKIHKSPTKKKTYLAISLTLNLGLLGFFKYFNFFISSWVDLFSSIGISQNISSLNIILPVGISFYTLQTLSYTLDVYYEEIEPTQDFISFLAFVSFFPQLVAGPIERAKNLLPQFLNLKKFNAKEASIGLQQILWGLLKKVVIADNCALYVNEIFGNSQNYHGGILIAGTILFAFQVYGDFSGYSDIAIGLGRLFGFKLMVNFRYPYFSSNISEFWRNWHISLYTWIQNYLFIPLSINKRHWGKSGVVFALLTSFFVSGLWHGANWTFIIFGLLNGLGVVFITLSKKIRKKTRKAIPFIFNHATSITITFLFWCITLVFFRSENLNQALSILYKSFTLSGPTSPLLLSGTGRYVFEMLPILIVFSLFEWFNRKREFPILGNWKKTKLAFCITTILVFGNFINHTDFIYFQF